MQGWCRTAQIRTVDEIVLQMRVQERRRMCEGAVYTLISLSDELQTSYKAKKRLKWEY